MITGMSDIEKRVLMELQYNFPLVSKPFDVVAKRLGTSVDEIIDVVKKMKELGILKRIGFYVNYKSYRQVAALVAFRTDEPEKLANEILKNFTTTHSYIRNHPYYNLWVVVRDKNKEALKNKIEKLATQNKADFVILWSKRVYRLSVKYDLEKGISRAGPFSKIVENPPSPSELGLDTNLVRALRVLPLKREPYKELATKYGLDEERLVEITKMLLEKGVLGDPGAALDGHRAGFTYNAMVVMWSATKETELCEWIINNVPEATHVVLREPWPPEKWRHNCYMMVHAVDETRLRPVYEKLDESPYVKDYLQIISLRDLLPGIIR